MNTTRRASDLLAKDIESLDVQKLAGAISEPVLRVKKRRKMRFRID